MKKAIVTGAAGFIGSHLCERLLREGFEITGIDSLTDYYDVRIKRKNLENLMGKDHFVFIERSINDIDLDDLVSSVQYVFHQAAQAGVRSSWGENFEIYIDSNIRTTQKLLESARGKNLKKFIYASSSSVYGDTNKLPMAENHTPKPASPYGVTKLSGEHLGLLYRKNYHIPVVSLRYFTVYGPRQRPDMAFHKFIRDSLLGRSIEIFGNGSQTRDFTFIDDIVEANLLAANYDGEESVFNIGGGSRITLNSALDILGECCRKGLEVKYCDPVKGDVVHTYADVGRAQRELGYLPRANLEEGLLLEVEWVEELYKKLETR